MPFTLPSLSLPLPFSPSNHPSYHLPPCHWLPWQPSKEKMLSLLSNCGTLTTHVHGCSYWPRGGKHTQDDYIVDDWRINMSLNYFNGNALILYNFVMQLSNDGDLFQGFLGISLIHHGILRKMHVWGVCVWSGGIWGHRAVTDWKYSNGKYPSPPDGF